MNYRSLRITVHVDAAKIVRHVLVAALVFFALWSGVANGCGVSGNSFAQLLRLFPFP